MRIKYFRVHAASGACVAGFSLIELMIAMAIGLFLMLGLTTLLVNTSASHTEMQKSSAQIENGRYATQILSEDLRLAGYFGDYAPMGYDLPEKPCAVAVEPVSPNMPSPVGYDLTAVASDFSCMSNLLAGTGVLVVRRAQTVSAAAAAAVAGTTYVQVSQCNSDSTATPFKFGTIASTGGFNLRTLACDSTTPAVVRKFVIHVYYISTCNACTPSSDGIPTLKMVEYVDGAFQAPVALVEGIEDMQFDYGIDTTGDGSPDAYFAAPAAAVDWADVMAVRVNVLARNIDSTAGYDDSKTYAVGLAKPTYTVPTGVARTYKRHAYSTLVRLENPSGRREVP